MRRTHWGNGKIFPFFGRDLFAKWNSNDHRMITAFLLAGSSSLESCPASHSAACLALTKQADLITASLVSRIEILSEQEPLLEGTDGRHKRSQRS
jgi:hypothetical protein